MLCFPAYTLQGMLDSTLSSACRPAWLQGVPRTGAAHLPVCSWPTLCLLLPACGPRPVCYCLLLPAGKTTSARIISTQAAIPLIYLPLEAVMSKW